MGAAAGLLVREMSMISFGELKAWIRLIVTVGIILVAALIILMNWNKQAELWFFGDFGEVPVLWLIVITAVVSVVGWKIVSGLWRVYAELRRVRDAGDKKQT